MALDHARHAPDPPGGGAVVPPRDWGGLAAAGALVVGTAAVYSGTFAVPLIYDDLWSISANPTIRRLWPLWPVFSPPDDAGVGGRPLLNLTFALNHALAGDGVASYHAVNLAIHILSALVLFGIVRRAVGRPPLAAHFGGSALAVAFLASAIWAWHPLQTVSVTYISQRAESLMGLFYLLTLYCFARGEEAGGGRGPRRAWFFLSVLACMAGAATKEVMVTAPIVVLLFDRAFFSGGFGAALRRHWALYAALVISLFPVVHRMLIVQRGGVVSGVGFGGGVSW